jgi:hypothetical protein
VVLSEVGKRFLGTSAEKLIVQTEPELFSRCLKALRDDTDMLGLINRALRHELTSVSEREAWSARAELNSETTNLIKSAVTEAKLRVMLEAKASVEYEFGNIIREELAKKLADDKIDEMIERRVSNITEREINFRVDEKFKARVAALMA